MAKELIHGTASGYRRCAKVLGASCEACRAAWVEHQLTERAKYAGSEPELNTRLDHGSPWTYNAYRCPCTPCVEAYREYHREYRARRRQAKT